ncbi:hypothetical protein LOAG_06518 [Loa loa]|uniref:Uncharacterized protein n=1 Tax=Loa loa TaxID=7209 RepID=A0A1S0TY89_LOALO|nr:hypothetical protein LOAG_06518 [Loa loa]EFO21967.1 hypothetical protein LOAG_06518 [Loa loa]
MRRMLSLSQRMITGCGQFTTKNFKSSSRLNPIKAVQMSSRLNHLSFCKFHNKINLFLLIFQLMPYAFHWTFHVETIVAFQVSENCFQHQICQRYANPALIIYRLDAPKELCD